jgi:hypothetical protein
MVLQQGSQSSRTPCELLKNWQIPTNCRAIPLLLILCIRKTLWGLIIHKVFHWG